MMRRLFIAAGLALLAIPSRSHAQGAILTGTTSAQWVQLRPLTLDSTSEASTDSLSPVMRKTAGGALTNCAPTDPYCYYYQSAPVAGLLAMTQDFDVTAWGLGQGISGDVQLRIRDAAGDGRNLWPQATQTVDVSAAYVDMARPSYDARLGRQWIASGLGMFNFDGAAVDVRPWTLFDANVYGGRSLIQGLDRPLGEAALAPVEDLPPPDDAFLVGAIVQLRSVALGSLRVQYQREVEDNDDALYSERFAADATWYVAGGVLTGDLTRDLAAHVFNDLGATYDFALTPQLHARVDARHYEPYFDLWTIWGAFSPVGYNEGTVALDWTASPRASFSLTGGRRDYDDTETGDASLPLSTDAWRLGATARYRPGGPFSIEGDYDIDLGFGASSTDGDVTLRWAPTARGSIGLRAMGFQNLNEFTIGTGTVMGGGFEGTFAIRPDVRFVGDATVYRHVGSDQSQTTDWNQQRISMRLEWTMGTDPGAGRPATGGKTP